MVSWDLLEPDWFVIHLGLLARAYLLARDTNKDTEIWKQGHRNLETTPVRCRGNWCWELQAPEPLETLVLSLSLWGHCLSALSLYACPPRVPLKERLPPSLRHVALALSGQGSRPDSMTFQRSQRAEQLGLSLAWFQIPRRQNWLPVKFSGWTQFIHPGWIASGWR